MMRCYDVHMRTTLELDDDVVRAARAIAAAEGRPLGRVVSELARRGLIPPPLQPEEEGGFPVFRVPEGAPPITDQMVRDAFEDV